MAKPNLESLFFAPKFFYLSKVNRDWIFPKFYFESNTDFEYPAKDHVQTPMNEFIFCDLPNYAIRRFLTKL